MARADLLVNLIKHAMIGNKTMVKKVVASARQFTTADFLM